MTDRATIDALRRAVLPMQTPFDPRHAMYHVEEGDAALLRALADKLETHILVPKEPVAYMATIEGATVQTCKARALEDVEAVWLDKGWEVVPLYAPDTEETL